MEFSIIKGLLDGLKPEPRLGVTEWADTYRMLASTSSAEPGQYRSSRTPYVREIQDKLSVSDPCQEVVFMAGAQVGKTESAFNWLGYIIDIAPAPTLLVQPTVDMAKRNSKMRLDPMVEATPRLREKIAPARSRDSGNTTLQKDFAGGTVVLTGANSSVGLRSMPAKNLMLDEVDAYPIDLDGEGSPVELAKARTRTFAKKKVFITSTPTVEGQSVIDNEYQQSDQRRFHVPCPHCEHMQHLQWENLRWDAGHPETVMYFCEECGAGIEERHKTWMLARGKWVAHNPDYPNKLRVGYHINSLYSPYGWFSWEDAVRQFEDINGNPVKEKVFVNTILGLTYKEKGEAPPWENLYNRREAYNVNKAPADVKFITVGVDVQKDRLELEVVGWCRDKITYSLDFRVILGDTSKPETWNKLARVVTETWELEGSEEQLPMRLMAIDTGYNTSHVYDFCRRYDATKVIPIKGSDSQQLIVSPPRSVDLTRAGKKIGKLKVWHVGVSVIKSELYGFLRQEIAETGEVPHGYCHFPQYDQHYFKGLTAEQLLMKVNKKGYQVYEWVKKFERNEPLDCRVYARAAACVVGLDRYEHNETFWNSFQTIKTQKTSEKPKKEVKRTDFWK